MVCPAYGPLQASVTEPQCTHQQAGSQLAPAWAEGVCRTEGECEALAGGCHPGGLWGGTSGRGGGTRVKPPGPLSSHECIDLTKAGVCI